jgi:hypothetical protein
MDFLGMVFPDRYGQALKTRMPLPMCAAGTFA